jgi:hypothetical protein
MLAVFAGGLVLAPHDWRRGLLAGAAVCGAWPLVLDAMLQPQFRRGVVGVPSMEVPGVGFIISGALASLCSFGLTVGEPDPEKLRQIAIAALVLPAIALLFAAQCLRQTWKSRTYLARLAGSPETIEGSLTLPDASGPQLAENKVLVKYGTAFTITPSSVGDDTTREAPLAKLSDRVDLHASGGGRWKLEMNETEWLSLERREDDLGANSNGHNVNRYDALTTSQLVLVHGAKRDGSLTTGPAGPPLIFAAAVGNGAIPALRGLVRRQRVTLGLLVLGLCAAVASWFSEG